MVGVARGDGDVPRSVEREIAEAQGSHAFLRSSTTDTSVGRQRAVALTEDELHDTCFRTSVAELLGGFANSQPLSAPRNRSSTPWAPTTTWDRDVPRDHRPGASWDPALEDFPLRAKKEL